MLYKTDAEYEEKIYYNYLMTFIGQENHEAVPLTVSH